MAAERASLSGKTDVVKEPPEEVDAPF